MPAENTTVGTAKALAEMELWELQPVLALLNTQNTFSFTRCKARGSNVFQCLGHKCHRKTHHSVALEATVLFTASLGRTFTLKTKCWIEQNWTHFWLLLLCARTWNCLHKDNKNWMCKTLLFSMNLWHKVKAREVLLESSWIRYTCNSKIQAVSLNVWKAN